MKKILFIVLFWVGIISNSVMAQTIPLNSGVSQDGAADKDEYQHYVIHASAGDSIKVELYDQDADGDLYVKIGGTASQDEYNCKSDDGGLSNESCTIPPLAQDADIYIAVYAYKCINNVQHTIKATVVGPNTVRLSSGVAKNGAADKDKYQHYVIHASAGDSVNVELYGQDADGDLYVKVGKKASQDDYDCKSDEGGLSNESCTIPPLAQDADIYIAVYAYKCLYNVQHTIKATVVGQNAVRLSSGVAKNGAADKDKYQHYVIHASAGDSVNVELYGQDADGDLYVKIGGMASQDDYDCKSDEGGLSNESCTIAPLAQDTDIHIAVYAYKCIYNVQHTIKATINADNDAYRFPPNTTLTSIGTRNIARPQKTSTEDINKASVTDPQFGSTITLINRSIAGFSYSKSQSWNADMTLLYTSYRLYNADTLEESPITSGLDVHQAFRKLGIPDGFRWSYVDPKIFYTFHSTRDNRSLVKHTIQANNEINHESWFNFDKIALNLIGEKFEKVSFGTNEAHFDKHNKWVVFTVKKRGDDHVYALLCNAKGNSQERETCKIKKLPDTSWGDIYVNGSRRPLHDWITITPNGNHILENKTINVATYANGNNFIDHEPETRIFMYDLNFENQQEIAPVAGHGDIGLDENGDQIYVEYDWRINHRNVTSYNLDAPAGQREKILLPDLYDGGHISCQNYKRPGWCYLSTRKEGYKEVFALKLDGSGTVNRFLQTRAMGNFESPFAGVSPDGKRVIFRSYWGGNNRYVYHAALKK